MANNQKPKKTTAKLNRNELSKLAFSMLEENQPKKSTTTSKTKKPQTTASKYVKSTPKKTTITRTSKPKERKINEPQSVVNKYLKSKPEEQGYLKRSERIKNRRYENSIYNKKATTKKTTRRKNEKLIIYDDKELLNYFIGDNHKKITKRFFNFSAFFFGGFYYLYRKFYIIGCSILAISLVLLYLIKDIRIIGAIFFTASLIMGFTFNFMYVKRAKNKIERIKEEHLNENINEYCVLAGGTDSLTTSLITVFYFIVILLFYFSIIFAWVTNLIDFSNKIEKKDNPTVFKDMVESYALQAKQNIEQPGLYKYKMDDEEYDFISLPVSVDDGDIYCVKLSPETKWVNKEGFEVKETSVTCEEFMNDIMDNYSKFYEVKIPITGEIVLSNQGKIIEGSKIEYEDEICEYQSNIKDFKCEKR